MERKREEGREALPETVTLRVAISFLVISKILNGVTDRWPDSLSNDGLVWTETPAVTRRHCGKRLLGCHMTAI